MSSGDFASAHDALNQRRPKTEPSRASKATGSTCQSKTCSPSGWLRAVTAQGAQFGPTGYEINLFYLAALLTLAVAPIGLFSVDDWLDKRRRLLHASA